MFVIIGAAAGVLLILTGTRLLVTMHGRHAAEVEAKCVDVTLEEYLNKHGFDEDAYKRMKKLKEPVYTYWYDGRFYTCQLPAKDRTETDFLPRTILISTAQPGKVYTAGRRTAAIMLCGAGIALLAAALTITFLQDPQAVEALLQKLQELWQRIAG